MYENYFSVFQRNPSHGLESLLGIFLDHCDQFSHPCGDHLFHRFSLVLVWMGLGELPKRLSIKLEIYLVIRALHRALGWRLAHRRRRRIIMSIVVLAGKKAEATVYLDPNISQTFIKAYRDAIEAWNQTGAFYFQVGHK